MSQFTKDAGLSAEGNPSFATVLKLAKALGCARQPQIAPFSEVLPTTD